MKRHILGLVCAALMGTLAACDTPVDETDNPAAPAAAAAETQEQGVRLDPCATKKCEPGQICQSPLDVAECVFPPTLCGGVECARGETCQRFGSGFEWCVRECKPCRNPTVCYPVCDPFRR